MFTKKNENVRITLDIFFVHSERTCNKMEKYGKNFRREECNGKYISDITRTALSFQKQRIAVAGEDKRSCQSENEKKRKPPDEAGSDGDARRAGNRKSARQAGVQTDDSAVRGGIDSGADGRIHA